MDESQFLQRAESCLARVETLLEAAADTLDTECSRSGNVLEIELIDNGSKIIVNLQSAMQQVWIAARAGGFHFSFDEASLQWRDTRDGSELFAALARLLSAQGGVQLEWQA